MPPQLRFVVRRNFELCELLPFLEDAHPDKGPQIATAAAAAATAAMAVAAVPRAA